MASRSKTRRRAPLMESGTEAALRRRGTELVGLVLLGLAALAATMILTYSPDDPSLFSATDEAPRNALGLVGASLADPLHRALGWAAYGISAVLGGLGPALPRSTPATSRAVRRAIVAPVALLVAASFAATHVPPAGWAPRVRPRRSPRRRRPRRRCCRCRRSTLTLSPSASRRWRSPPLFVLASGYVLGVTWAEARGFLRFLGQGTVVLYSGAHSLTGKAVSTAASGAKAGARAARDRAAESRARRTDPEPEPGMSRAALAEAAPRPTARRPQRREPDGEDHRGRPRAARERRGGGPAPPDHPAPDRRRRRSGGARARSACGHRGGRDDDDLRRRSHRAARPAAPAATRSSRAPAPAPRSSRSSPSTRTPPWHWQTPPLSLLQNPATIVRHHLSNDALEENARMLEIVLDDYGVRGEITSVRPGPVVTMYELEPAAGLKASRVIGLSDDIARSMSALAARVSTVPGRT